MLHAQGGAFAKLVRGCACRIFRLSIYLFWPNSIIPISMKPNLLHPINVTWTILFINPPCDIAMSCHRCENSGMHHYESIQTHKYKEITCDHDEDGIIISYANLNLFIRSLFIRFSQI